MRMYRRLGVGMLVGSVGCAGCFGAEIGQPVDSEQADGASLLHKGSR